MKQLRHSIDIHAGHTIHSRGERQDLIQAQPPSVGPNSVEETWRPNRHLQFMRNGLGREILLPATCGSLPTFTHDGQNDYSAT
jgi:hypothetical protein